MAYETTDIYRICEINAEAAYRYQQRRHQQWNDNYGLYRDTVKTNRLIQRQTVNVPMMKYIIKTALKETDDPVDLYYRNRDNDKQKELFLNAFWEQVKKDQKIDLKDKVDKKQEAQYGRSTSSWNIDAGQIIFEIDDTFDIFFDKYTDPTDIDATCRYMQQRHIFRSLKTVLHDEMYSKEALERLQTFYSTDAGAIYSAENTDSLRAKNERLEQMGVTNLTDIEVGETIVELNLHWVLLWHDDHEQEEICYVVTCDREVLYWGWQEEVIGETSDNYWRRHFIKTSWAGDLEVNDMYSDGLSDTIRQPNKIANAYFSQDIENRTLRNFGMNYYNSSIDGWAPQTYEPIPGAWYPIPLGEGGQRKISDVMTNVRIEPLGDTLPALQFMIGMTEKAAATSSTQSGQVNQDKVTLGEIELTLGEAKERLKASENYYLPAWYERGVKFVKLIEASPDRIDAVRIFKKGYRGNMFGKTMAPGDWQTPNGYEIEIIRKSEMRSKAIETINVMNGVRSAMPNNTPLIEVYERKMVDLIPDLTPDEVKQITDFQKKQREAAMTAASAGMGARMPAQPGGAATATLPPGQSQQLMLPQGRPQAPMSV